MEAADGQLKEGCDPYRLVLPAERETLAEYYADELRAALRPTPPGPAERFLVGAPEAPLQFKAYDGEGVLRREVGALPLVLDGGVVGEVEGRRPELPGLRAERVEWRSPEVFEGHLRLLRAASRRTAVRHAARQADQDPAAVVFGLGYGPVHESLPFAAAVLAAVRAAEPAGHGAGRAAAAAVRAAAGPGRHRRADPALGELHEAGLVTDEEFCVKKAELLAEL